MKRTFTTTTIAVALAGLLSACKGGAGDAVKVIPEAATMVGGVDVAGLLSSKLYTDNLKAMVEEGPGKDALAALKECGLGLDKFKSVTFGTDGKSDKNSVYVVAADGIGKKETLECLAKAKDKLGAELTIESDGKVVKAGPLTGYVVNDNTLAVAGEGWASAVKDLVDGKGKPVTDGALKDVIGRADTGKTVWFAGVVPTEMGTMAQGMLGSAPKDVAGSVDLSSGLAVKASVGLASADDATKAKEAAEKQFAALKDSAPADVPKSAIESVKFGTDGSAVTVEASISNDDLGAIAKQAAGIVSMM
jgi:hypothetical protein